MKGLRVPKIVKEITFEGTWGNLEVKSRFQSQSLTKYLRQTLVFMLNSTLQEKSNFYFQKVLLVLKNF